MLSANSLTSNSAYDKIFLNLSMIAYINIFCKSKFAYIVICEFDLLHRSQIATKLNSVYIVISGVLGPLVSFKFYIAYLLYFISNTNQFSVKFYVIENNRFFALVLMCLDWRVGKHCANAKYLRHNYH